MLGAQFGLRHRFISREGGLTFVEDLVPVGDVGCFVGEESVGGIEDIDGLDAIALLDGIDDVLSFGDFAEHCVFAVEPVGGHVGDEELASVGSRACVGHGEDAGFGVFEGGVEFVTEAVTWAAHSCSGWVAALDHEVFDDAVKFDSVVISSFCEVEEVCAGHGDL